MKRVRIQVRLYSQRVFANTLLRTRAWTITQFGYSIKNRHSRLPLISRTTCTSYLSIGHTSSVRLITSRSDKCARHIVHQGALTQRAIVYFPSAF